MSFTPLFPSAANLPPEKEAGSHVVSVGQSYKGTCGELSASGIDGDRGQRLDERSSKGMLKNKESKKRKHHHSKSDKHHRHQRHDKEKKKDKDNDKDKDRTRKKHTSHHSNRKKTTTTSSEHNWSSDDDRSIDDSGCDDTSKSDKKLFLPNGQYFFKDEYGSEKQQTNEKCWTISRSGDLSVFQFGVYRLDIPSYDIYAPSTETSKNSYLSSDFMARINHKLPSGIVAASETSSSTLPRKKKGKITEDDDETLSRQVRYFRDSGNSAGVVIGAAPQTNPVYRLWMKHEHSSSGRRDKDICGQSSLILFPAPLPELDEQHTSLPPTSKGISSNIVAPRDDILTAANFSTFGKTGKQGGEEKISVLSCMKTEGQLLQQKVAHLSMQCRALHTALCEAVTAPSSSSSSSPSRSLQPLTQAHRWLELASKSGQLASLQLLLSKSYNEAMVTRMSSRSSKLSLSLILSASIESEYAVIKEAVNFYKNKPEWLPLFYQALLFYVNILQKVTPLTSSLYRQLVFDDIWTEILQDCPLNIQLRRMYTSYQLTTFLHANDQRKSYSVVGGNLWEKCEGDGEGHIFSTVYRQLLSTHQQTGSIIAAVSNKSAAKNLLDLTREGSSGREGVGQALSPPRLQEDLDCFQVSNFITLCHREADGGHMERQVALVQAALAVNLSVFPSALLLAARGTTQIQHSCEEDLEAAVLNEFEVYWESEYVRLGEEVGREEEEGGGEGDDMRWKGMGGGYSRWVSAGRPVEGWAVSRGLTGHTYSSPRGEGQGDGGHGPPEPTANEYLTRARLMIGSSDQCANYTSSPPSMQPQPRQQQKKQQQQQGMPEVEVERISDKCMSAARQSRPVPKADSTSSSTATLVPRQSEEVGRPQTLTTLEASVDSDGDEYIYSAIHGYRIRVPKDKHSGDAIDKVNTETLAYKRILGDIKDEDLTNLSAEDILQRYDPASSTSLGPPSPLPPLLPLSEESRVKQRRSEESILSLLQWRPLRVNANSDMDAAVAQPDRVLFKEDLSPHMFVVQSTLGREFLVAQSLQLLGVRPQSLLGGMAISGPPPSSSSSSTLSDQEISAYWENFLSQFTDGRGDSFCSVLQSLLHETYRHPSQRTGHRSSDPLLALNDRAGNWAGSTARSTSTTDVVGTVLTEDLMRRHLACTLVGVASPLVLTISLVKQLLQLHMYTRRQVGNTPNLEGGTGSQFMFCKLHALKSNGLFSAPFYTQLKCCLLKLLNAKYLLDGKVSSWKYYQEHVLSIDSNGVDMSFPLSLVDRFQLDCQAVLQPEGEELATGRGLSMPVCFDVWNTYARSEIIIGNVTQARKVCSRSLVALGNSVAVAYARGEDDLDRVCVSRVATKSLTEQAVECTLENHLRKQLVTIMSDTARACIDASFSSSGVSDLLQVNQEMECWRRLLRLSCGDISGGLDLYLVTLQLLLKPLSSHMVCTVTTTAPTPKSAQASQYESKSRKNNKNNEAAPLASSLDEKRGALFAAVLLLLQLAQGGTLAAFPVLATELSTALKGKNTNKGKTAPSDKSKSHSTISSRTLAVTTCQLQAMVMALWSRLKSHIGEERARQSIEEEIDATRLQAVPKPGFSSSSAIHFSSFVQAVVLLAWWTFLCDQYTNVQSLSNARTSSNTASSTTKSRSAIGVFDCWIDNILDLLFLKTNPTNPIKGDMTSDYSRFLRNLLGPGAISSRKRASWSRMAVFDVLQSCGGTAGGLWQSAEEQGLLYCLEALYMQRVHFSLLTLVYWDYSYSDSLARLTRAGIAFHHQQCLDDIREYVLEGLFDFPLNGGLTHVLMSLHLATTSDELTVPAGAKITLQVYIRDVTHRLSVWGGGLETFGHTLQLCVLLSEGFLSVGEGEAGAKEGRVQEVTHWCEDAVSKLFVFLDSLLLPHLPGSEEEGGNKKEKHRLISFATGHSVEQRRRRCFSTLAGRNSYGGGREQIIEEEECFPSLNSSPVGHRYGCLWRVFIKCLTSELLGGGAARECASNTAAKTVNSRNRGLHFKLSLKRRMYSFFAASHGAPPLLCLQGQDISAASACLANKRFWLQHNGVVDLVFAQQQLMARSPTSGLTGTGDSAVLAAEDALYEDMQEKMAQFGILTRGE